MAYDVNAGLTQVSRIDTLDNINFSGFKITYDIAGEPIDDLFENTLTQFNSSAALSVRNTRGIEINDIFIENMASHGLEINDSIGAHINNYTADGAFNKGSGGNGYALHIKGTSDSTFENLTITDTRHAVTFGSWSAETNNDIHVLYTNRDINYHGSDDHSNTVIVDVMDYDAHEDKAWSIIDTGGEIHPYTNIYANTTLFTYAYAGDRDDIFWGTDNGATLFGNNGNDTIIGGMGDDIISGGTGDDILTGGAGNDTFIMGLSFNHDVVTDFSINDTITLQDYYGIDDFDDLHIQQNGDDTLITFSASDELYNSLTLENFDADNLTSNNFLFQNTSNTPQTSASRWASLWDYIMAGDGNDVANGYFSDILADDIIDLGLGTDTIEILTTSYNFDTTGYINLKGVDIVDATQSTRARFYFN